MMAGVVSSILLLTACGAGSAPQKADASSGAGADCVPSTFSIGRGTGLGYAPMIVAEGAHIFEKKFPDTKFKWQVLSGGSASRDAMLSGSIDMGAGGITPFLVGWDKGIDAKVLSSAGDLDYWLVAMNKEVKTIADITPSMRIAVTSPDSGQAIALNTDAQAKLGHDVKSQMVPMPHPDALAALISGQVDLHYSSPPFQYQELAEGAHVVAKGTEAWGGPFAFALISVNKKTADCAVFAKGLYDGIVQAMNILKTQPEEAAKFLSDSDNGKTSVEQYEGYLKQPGIDWTPVPHKVIVTAKASKAAGTISKVPSSMSEIVATAVPSDARGD